MSASSVTLLHLTRPHWPAVLVSCLLSVLAPFAESTVVQLLTSVSPPSTAEQMLSEEEDSIEDEEDLYRVRGPNDSWRAERQQADFPIIDATPDSPDPSLTPFFARRASAYHRGPGCEHAYRNGRGGPLLC